MSDTETITTVDAEIRTDTYSDEDGPYTVVTVTPHDAMGNRVVVIVDDVDVYREGSFV